MKIPQLGPLLLEMINIAVHKVLFERDVQYLFHFYLKKGNVTQWPHYRPLSLINTDMKPFFLFCRPVLKFTYSNWYIWEQSRCVKNYYPQISSVVYYLTVGFCWCQECAKLSSRQSVATLKNLKYKIDFDLFNTF